jgi:hypothetical protein
MIISPLISVAVFVTLFMNMSATRRSCDELAREKLNSLSHALSKVRMELSYYDCPGPEGILQGLTEDQLQYLVNRYYEWDGSDEFTARLSRRHKACKVLFRKQDNEISAYAQWGSFPSVFGADQRFIFRRTVTDGAELPAIAGKCEGRTYYAGRYLWDHYIWDLERTYNGSVFRKEDIKNGQFIVRKPDQDTADRKARGESWLRKARWKRGR